MHNNSGKVHKAGSELSCLHIFELVDLSCFCVIFSNLAQHPKKTETMYSHRQSMVKFEISGYSNKVYM